MNTDYRSLPKLRDSISYIYLEHAIVEQEDSSIVAIRQDGRISVPISAVTCLMLGPGTSVTHSAIKTAAENGCMIVWCGENGLHFYSQGNGETRSADNVILQARLCMNEDSRLEVAKRMYIRRFGNIADPSYTLQQLRGMEGIRVREAYKIASKATGVPWSGRTYKEKEWDKQDTINMALSQSNSILYSICQAAIVSLGYSTALGFIHTGKQLSFVYDIADLYKATISIPAAFYAVKYKYDDLSSAVRRTCRNMIQKERLLKRIPEDIEWIFRVQNREQIEALSTGNIWDPQGELPGGVNYQGDNDIW